MILAGKSERAAKALRIGLVDEVVPRSILLRTAIAAAERLAREGLPRRAAQQARAPALFLDRTPAGRRLVYRKAKAELLARTGGHYPAPLAALETVRVGLEHGITAGLAEEHHAFGQLAVGDVSRKLVQIFFATTALKKDDGIAAGAANPRQIRRLGVVGAGFMGAGIAGTAVVNVEVDTRLKDADLARVGKGLGAAGAMLADRLKKRRITRATARAADRAALRRRRLRRLRPRGPGDRGGVRGTRAQAPGARRSRGRHPAATRSSPATPPPSRSTRSPAGAQRPERVLGMHYFSPVREDAAAGGDPDRRHRAGGDRRRRCGSAAAWGRR